VIFVRPEVGAMVRPASEPMVPALRMSASMVPDADALMKEARPVKVEVPPTERFPAVTKLPAVTLVPTVSERLRFSEPEKEFDAVALVWVIAERTESVEPKVTAPEMEAVPPTSRDVSVAPPALIPSLVLPVSSKLPETEALASVLCPVTVNDASVVVPALRVPRVEVPVTFNRPNAVISSPRMPLLISSEPAKDEEPVPLFI